MKNYTTNTAAEIREMNGVWKKGKASKTLDQKILDVMCEYDVFMDIPNMITASVEAQHFLLDIKKIINSEVNRRIRKRIKEL